MNIRCLIGAIAWMSIRQHDVRFATIARKFTNKEANCRLDNGTVIRARGWPTESKAVIIRDAHVFHDDKTRHL